MKISKLFHWLYGFLMLLPVFGVLFKVGYVMLNENAYQSYSGSYSYNGEFLLYEEDTLTWTTYHSQGSLYAGKSSEDNNLIGNLNYKNIANQGNYTYAYGFPNVNINSSSLNITDFVNVKSFIIGRTDPNNYSSLTIRFYDVIMENGFYIFGESKLYNSQGVLITPIQSINVNMLDFNINFTNNYNYLLGYSYFREDWNTSYLLNKIYKQEFVIDTTLSSVFYSSLQELDDTEFFSWAKDSFLVQPIMYVGNLFGITSPHPIFTFMSYWLSISIIWLVFDLVMYLPLLVHRWLDKGVIE